MPLISARLFISCRPVRSSSLAHTVAQLEQNRPGCRRHLYSKSARVFRLEHVAAGRSTAGVARIAPAAGGMAPRRGAARDWSAVGTFEENGGYTARPEQ